MQGKTYTTSYHFITYLLIAFDTNANASRIRDHMACKFPLRQQGLMPQRCLSHPYIRIQQSGFSCKGTVYIIIKIEFAHIAIYL
jgi:hypothetical protein